ncbi:MAG: hypothetical protein CMJ83_21015 [Planctomycetes bacterium]|nr:hypothetical protein [Planctomycetota bacterium]
MSDFEISVTGAVVPHAPDAPATGRGKDVFVGRQPIYDRALNLVAYELLFRSGDVDTANVIDGDQATFKVMLNALVEIGLKRLVGDKKAFINLTRNSVLCEYAQFFPKDQVVMEVLEDVTVDQELLDIVHKFADQGYQIALDDFDYREELAPLLEIADMVKIDVQALDDEAVRDHVEKFGNLKLLAEKVETKEEFEFCKRLGFQYFQGWFLAKPKVITVKHVPTSQLATLRLLAALYSDDPTDEDLAEVICQDVSLSYRLMRTVNPDNFDHPIAIESVVDAVGLLGRKELNHWVTLLSISGQDDIEPELMLRAMTRGRFCELLGECSGAESSSAFFIAGQLSTIDALVGAPMGELIENVPLAPDISLALLGGEGPIADALTCITAIESGQNDLAFPGLTSDQIRAQYDDALQWADDGRLAMGY